MDNSGELEATVKAAKMSAHEAEAYLIIADQDEALANTDGALAVALTHLLDAVEFVRRAQRMKAQRPLGSGQEIGWPFALPGRFRE